MKDKDPQVVAPVAKWVKQPLYMRMTGHTRDTLKLLRRNHLKEGRHWKRGMEGPGTYYFNHAAIDRLLEITKTTVV